MRLEHCIIVSTTYMYTCFQMYRNAFEYFDRNECFWGSTVCIKCTRICEHTYTTQAHTRGKHVYTHGANCRTANQACTCMFSNDTLLSKSTKISCQFIYSSCFTKVLTGMTVAGKDVWWDQNLASIANKVICQRKVKPWKIDQAMGCNWLKWNERNIRDFFFIIAHMQKLVDT